MTKPSASRTDANNNDDATRTPILVLDDVSYAYAKGGRRVVDHVSTSFHRGEVTSIVGPSGAGKTTLLSLISGLTTPTEGAVLFDGTDLATMDRYRYRSRDIGVIFQSFNLLPQLTVLENIMLTMDASGKRFDRPKKDIALELLGRVHLPERYANERILHLSGGEQQRVAIARALSDDPRVIIADEPTGNLDPVRSLELMLLFEKINEMGTTVMVVTHEKELVNAFSKRVITIDGGNLISDGMDGYYSYEIE